MTETPAFRGTPPNQKTLSQRLGSRFFLWEAVIDLGKAFEATWRWAHSEKMGAWSNRAYLPGDRFFMAMSLTQAGFEVSFNLMKDEWDSLYPEGAEEIAFLALLREKALASGEEPAWVHMPLATEADLKALSKLLAARGRRVQLPRGKKNKKR
jgi:hypothetical protein